MEQEVEIQEYRRLLESPGQSWPSGAKMMLRVGPSLSALDTRLRIGQLEHEWLERWPRAIAEVIDEKPCDLMISLVELPNPFDIVVMAKHSLPYRQTVREQHHESDAIVD